MIIWSEFIVPFIQKGTDNNENNNQENVANENSNKETNNTVKQTPAPKFTYYTVKSGDTLYKIADRKGASATGIKKANPSINWNRLQVGQKIKIPGKA